MHLSTLTAFRFVIIKRHSIILLIFPPSFFFTLYRNVFKRLRVLGNKMVSHFITLLFLTLWHGLHSGYFMCFSLEFVIVTVEKQVEARLNQKIIIMMLMLFDSLFQNV